MNTRTGLRRLCLFLPIVCGACQTAPYDYSAFIDHQPRSILVLPPLNETLEVDAGYGSLSTLTRPLAEQGFYIFPVALVDAIMRSNGLPSPGEMHQVPLSKLVEIFDPDAVLYVTATDWGSSYQVFSSRSSVSLQATLIDARTGTLLWAGSHSVVKSSGDGGGGILGALASAIVSQVVSSVSDPSRSLSRETARQMFGDPRSGLLPGPYNPEHESRTAAAVARSAKEKSK